MDISHPLSIIKMSSDEEEIAKLSTLANPYRETNEWWSLQWSYFPLPLSFICEENRTAGASIIPLFFNPFHKNMRKNERCYGNKNRSSPYDCNHSKSESGSGRDPYCPLRSKGEICRDGYPYLKYIVTNNYHP